MGLRIEDYAVISDTQSAALIGIDGSIDWLCFPRFDSGACFAALLGKPEHGRWLLAPEGPVRKTRRRYRGDSLVLETEFHTDDGVVRVIDGMPIRTRWPDLARMVEGVEGKVRMRMELVIRFDYGSIIPWVRKGRAHALHAIGGPDALEFLSPVPTRGEGLTTVATFDVSPGERVPFLLTWHPSHEDPPTATDPVRALVETEQHWQRWSDRCTYRGPWREAVLRSLLTLKALTYSPSGGIVAAVTTSLPEQIGGVRNWDYRYCWVRDATLCLYALLQGGYQQEARAWRDWLLRSVAGSPDDLRTLYGVRGERRLPELELPWLPGYENSSPVRVGNAAVNQLQLDVYGELTDALYTSRRVGMPNNETGWRVQLKFIDWLERNWSQPDEGIWEVRGPRRHFTHSKVMCWVALDRMVKMVEEFGVKGPADRWRAVRDRIHAEVCEKGWSETRGSFTQFYGSDRLDASLLLIPQVGFLPASDPRVVKTVEAIQRELVQDGFVLRYQTDASATVDGLPPGEGAFLPCSFWLADALAMLERRDEAHELFERLLSLRNDVGLLSEEYDPRARRLVGNFPQAFSHIALVDTASNLARLPSAPGEHRGDGQGRAGSE
ncbi:MAG TPA: glycoside hydrolase family 15 protein [Myxococcaceae bacterium]|nr:glycoside hydrolase family 15 protein [Myxococcaceae bacterium]